MHRAVILGGLICLLTYFCGCSTQQLGKITQYLPANEPTLPIATAIPQALKLSSLTESDQPFHLLLAITPAPKAPSEMHGEIELYWLNRLTYRTVIHAPNFTQTRIVNGPIVEEHNTGTYYPRWLQNFTEALLNPIPNPEKFSRLPGAIPIGPQSHPCLSLPAEVTEAQLCLQGPEPKLASIQTFSSYISFDDYAPYNNQQIPRRLINALPANILLEGRILRIEPLRQSDYKLLKATQFTADRIQTTLLPESAALAQLEFNPRQPWPPNRTTPIADIPTPMHLYIRTDRTGQVREAYRDPTDIYGLQKSAVQQALKLKFKPLKINNLPQQIESPLTLP